MRLAVIGTGYVGLVVGACFADAGHHVSCVDVDAAKVDALRRGEPTLHEPGLGEVLRRAVNAGRLHFTTALPEAVAGADAVFITVGARGATAGEAEARPVLEVAAAVAEALTRPALVVVKSTVPVGTAERVRDAVATMTTQPVEVVSNPEFLREGSALADFLEPERVVVGAESDRAREAMEALYRPFLRDGRPLLFMDSRSAELTKYAANAMLATRISFMNDVAALCERLGADVGLVRRGVETDSRIGAGALEPGVGFGGSCLPKDVRALAAMARQVGLEPSLLDAVQATNERQKHGLVEKARAHYGDLAGRRFALWGLAFKERTDDVRESPALALVDALLAEGAAVTAFDPAAMPNARRLYGARVTFANDAWGALPGADGLFVATGWSEFRAPDFGRLRALLASPVLFDGRNLYSAERVRALGFTWYGVGRT